MAKILPHEVIYILTFFFACGLFFLAWPRRRTTGGTFFIGQLLGLIIWNIGSFFEAVSTTIAAKVFWSQFCYIGFVAVSPFFFLFVLAYTTQSKIKPSLIFSLFIIPAVTLLAAWTNSWHHLIWTNLHWGSVRYNILIYDHGFLFFVHAIYIYILVFFVLGLVLQKIPKSRPPFRSQLIIILIGSLFPIITSALYVLKFEPIPGMDISSFGFLLTNILLVYGFARYQLLDLVPVARDALIEYFQDGMVVLDWQNRIVEVNQNAKGILHIPQKSFIGSSLSELFPWVIDLKLLSSQSHSTEFCLSEEKNSFIDMRVSSLASKSASPPGYLIVIRDISMQKRTELQLKKANENLQNQINEINHLQEMLKDQATHDSLTSLYNRRLMDEILSEQLAQARQNHQSFSVIIMDIDHFKNINDEFGHQTGDTLLEEFGRCILKLTRKTDFSCRLGGDEILLAFQNMPLPEAQIKAELVRKSLQEIILNKENRKISTTVSVGIATFPIHGQNIKDLISQADKALYRAKEKGRNQIVLADLSENNDNKNGVI